MKKLLGLLAMIFLGSFAAQAQVAPYAMFSAGHYSGLGVGVGTSNTQSGGETSLGGTFGVNDDFIHIGPVASIGGDVRLMVQNSANSTQYGNKLVGALAGARVSANPVVLPFRPYAQVEIGPVATNWGKYTDKTTYFGYQFQFGGDFTVVPHLGVRLEYGVGQLSTELSTHHTLQTFGAGLVLRL